MLRFNQACSLICLVRLHNHSFSLIDSLKLTRGCHHSVTHFHTRSSEWQSEHSGSGRTLSFCYILAILVMVSPWQTLRSVSFKTTLSSMSRLYCFLIGFIFASLRSSMDSWTSTRSFIEQCLTSFFLRLC